MRLLFTREPERYAAFTVLLVPKPFGQLHGDKECPFSGVTSSGSVWRKVPESDECVIHIEQSLCTWSCHPTHSMLIAV